MRNNPSDLFLHLCLPSLSSNPRTPTFSLSPGKAAAAAAAAAAKQVERPRKKMASLPDRFPPGVAALRPQQEEDAGPGSLQEEDRERWKVAAAAKVFSSNGRRKEVAGGGRFSSGTSLSRLYHHHRRRRRRRRVRGLIRLGFNHEANSKEGSATQLSRTHQCWFCTPAATTTRTKNHPVR